MSRGKQIGFGVGILLGLIGCAVFAERSSKTDNASAVPSSEEISEFMEHQAYDPQDLADGAEIQRLFFNQITPPGVPLLQPMIPLVVPFDATDFPDSFLDDLLGEEKNSVAIYPLSLVLDPQTRETLVYNAEGKLIAAVPAEKASDVWPEGADPARVTLLLDLLPSEDVELYLYVDSRITETLSATKVRTSRNGGASAKSLGSGEFGICFIQKLTNGNVRVTVTNGDAVAETFIYTVLHSASNVVMTNGTFTLWTPLSPSFNGIESDWVSGTTNLVLTNGVGVWEDTNISSNDRVRYYATSKFAHSDGDQLSDGMEIFIYHTNPDSLDTDNDGLLDGYSIAVSIGDSRYELWAGYEFVYTESGHVRTFAGELSLNTDPLDADTDGDSLPDGWEVQNELDPLDDGDVNSENGLFGDPDGDDFSNQLEYEFGAPANNPAWNGAELAYRLTHAHIVTNTRSVATNFIGMHVDIDISSDCGGTAGTQNRTDNLDVPTLQECGYYIDIQVAGLVEDVSNKYDVVTFEAYTNTFYFKGHNNGNPECRMASDSAMRNVLIMGGSTVKLRYNTVSYKWHDGAFAEIMNAETTSAYKVNIGGESKVCVGDSIQLMATGGHEPYAWSGGGAASVNSNGIVTGVYPGFVLVTATESNGCAGTKEIMVMRANLGSVEALADRTSHPDAARKSLTLQQTEPTAWDGEMELSLSGAVAYWTPTGGVPIVLGSTVFTNSQLPRTIYLEGDGCGQGSATFSVVGPPGCSTNISFTVLSVYIDKIAFNYKPASATDDALNIRDDFTTAISVPEYVKGGQNKPAAYIKNKTVKMLVRLKVEPSTITSLKIKGVSDDTNGSLGNATEKTVTFSGGISQEGTDDASTTGIDESEYVEFTITGNTPNKIFKSEEAWNWIVTEVNGSAVSDMEVERTSGHKVYVLWDTPKSPWNQTSGNAKNPWVKALTFAIETASGHDKDDAGALAAITSYLHTGHGLTYDIVAGDSTYASSHLGGTMQLTKYIDKSLGNTVNCYDQASGVCSFGTLLGIDVTYRFMNPFGYINTVDLVGEGNCNNPFYGNPGITGGKITGSDQVEPVRAAFGNHAFAKYGGNIYDACAGPHTGTRTEAQYVSDTVDTSTPVEANPPWCAPKAAGDTANIIGGSVSDLQ